MSRDGPVAAERRRGATTDGRAPMAIYRACLGIDSHLRTTTICALTPEDGELRTRTSEGNDYGEMAEWMAGFPQPSHGACESGRAGFVPARAPARGDASVFVVYEGWRCLPGCRVLLFSGGMPPEKTLLCPYPTTPWRIRQAPPS